jgi:hypothetical protein
VRRRSFQNGKEPSSNYLAFYYKETPPLRFCLFTLPQQFLQSYIPRRFIVHNSFLASWLSFFPLTTVVTSLVFMILFDFQLGPLWLPNSDALPEEFSWVLNMDLMLKSWRREDRPPDTSWRWNSRFIQISAPNSKSVY